jgi:hypothetical protein
MPTYDITIDSPSTGNTVNSPFTATGMVSSSDNSAFDYAVDCSLTSFMTGEKRVVVTGTGPGTWSFAVPGNRGTYTLDAKLYINPTTNPPTGEADATDSVSNVIVSATPAPIGIISIDDPLPDPPAPESAAKRPNTREITVVGSYDPNGEAASITCVVTAEQDNNTKGSKHHYVVSALTFPASDFRVTMHAPHRRRYAVHAMAFRADGTLLATSTMHHPKKR